jgi:hypothetical protein
MPSASTKRSHSKEQEMKRSEFIRPGRSWKEGPSRIGTGTTRTLLLALALAFVVGACDAYAQGGGGGSSGGGDLTLSIAAPSDGAEVSIPFDVTLESNVALGSPESGNYHVHLFFDTDTASSEYELVYGPTVQVTRELGPGEHTIIASLRNADHSDAGVSQTITVVVAGAGGGGASPVPAATPVDLGY